MGYFLYLIIALCTGCAHAGDISKNIAYKKITTKMGQTAHVATLNSREVELKLVKADGLQKVSELAQAHKAPLAINAGFFQTDGKPAGALKIDNEWIAKPRAPRGLMGWNSTEQGTELFFDRVSNERDQIKSVYYDYPWWNNTQYVIAGAPLLIKNGQKVDVSEEKTDSLFLSNQYARTAICVDKDNNIKLVVFDGGDRITNKFQTLGVSVDELSDFLLDELDCEQAINIDGGYSSAFVVNGAKVNSYTAWFMPERSVGNALLVFEKD